jgi:dienelactone hydrolase
LVGRLRKIIAPEGDGKLSCGDALRAVNRLLLTVLFLFAIPARAATAAETRSLTLAEKAALVDLYWPAATPLRGLVVIAHGFTRSRARHVVLARRLADEGFAVAVPDLPHSVRVSGNADAIVDLVKVLETERGLAGRPTVLIGTSAGGLATLLTADQVPRLALWVGLDPVDTLGLSAGAARALRAPAVVLRAPSGPCNVGGSARRIAAWIGNLRAEVRVDGASHCDFEDSTTVRCEAICGPADPARQAFIVDATVKAVTEAVPGRAAAD